MSTRQFLQETQPIVYKTILNGFKKKKTSHAYLLSGGKGLALKETATFLAQSFLCDEKKDDIACEECVNCIRIKENNYSDLIVIDGDKTTIKKEMIDNLQAEFTKTALEEKGLKIYIIHLIEKATTAAINGLLKFLEEPSDDVVAILTTENISKVLPTIVSRCQLLRLKTFSKTNIIDVLQEKGVSLEDAKILTTFRNSEEEILKVLEEETYNMLKDVAIETYLEYKKDKDMVFYMQKNVHPLIKSKDDCHLFLELLELLFKDNILNEQKIFDNEEYVLEEYQKANIEKIILAIIDARSKIELNVNIPLLLDQLGYRILNREGGK